MAYDGPKLASRCLQVGPSWPLFGLKIVPYGPYVLLMDRRFAPRGLKVSYLNNSKPLLEPFGGPLLSSMASSGVFRPCGGWKSSLWRLFSEVQMDRVFSINNNGQVYTRSVAPEGPSWSCRASLFWLLDRRFAPRSLTVGRRWVYDGSKVRIRILLGPSWGLSCGSSWPQMASRRSQDGLKIALGSE